MEMPTAFPDVIAFFALVLTLPSHMRASMADSRLISLSVIVIEWEIGDSLLKNPSICCCKVT